MPTRSGWVLHILAFIDDHALPAKRSRFDGTAVLSRKLASSSVNP